MPLQLWKLIDYCEWWQVTCSKMAKHWRVWNGHIYILYIYIYIYIYIRGRPINRFCRLIGTDSWFAGTIGYRQKSMPIVFRVASVAGVVENGLLSLYSTRAASGGGNHWQHVLFVLACDIEREIPDSHLNTADRKSCRGTERHSHSFLFNYIMYINNDLGQI